MVNLEKISCPHPCNSLREAIMWLQHWLAMGGKQFSRWTPYCGFGCQERRNFVYTQLDHARNVCARFWQNFTHSSRGDMITKNIKDGHFWQYWLMDPKHFCLDTTRGTLLVEEVFVLFGLNLACNNLSIILRWCLDVAGSSMLTFSASSM